MNSKITFLVLLVLPLFIWSQEDIPQKPLKIDVANKLDEKGETDKGTSLRIPDIIKEQPEIDFDESLTKRKPVKMLPEKKLLQAGHNMKIDPKVGPRTAKEGSKDHFPDQNLGEIKSNGKFVGIVCRDHEYVDGDRVKISVNGKVADPNILLTGAYKGVNADLEKGFNQLVFEALNEGSSSPNTAQIDVYDDEGKIIYSNKWLLSAGSKATLIITKD